MKNMKKISKSYSLICSIVLLVGIIFLSGCNSLGETGSERTRRWEQITQSNLDQVADDVDAFWLLDKRSKLTDRLIRD